jgi:hypothetical protein
MMILPYPGGSPGGSKEPNKGGQPVRSHYVAKLQTKWNKVTPKIPKIPVQGIHVPTGATKHSVKQGLSLRRGALNTNITAGSHKRAGEPVINNESAHFLQSEYNHLVIPEIEPLSITTMNSLQASVISHFPGFLYTLFLLREFYVYSKSIW